MNNKDFVGIFKKDFSYYDQEKVELKTILSLVNFKQNNTLLDIGAGIGRLAIPLSKNVKVTAIDTNKHLLNEIKNVKTINKDINDYYPKGKFDYGLIAWPQFEDYNTIFEHIKKNVLKKNGKLIIIKSRKHSLREIIKRLFPELFGSGKPNFLEVLPKYFNIEKERIIETDWVFPNLKEAFRLIPFEIYAFYNRKVNNEQKQILLEYLKDKVKSGKVYLDAKVKVMVCG